MPISPRALLAKTLKLISGDRQTLAPKHPHWAPDSPPSKSTSTLREDASRLHQAIARTRQWLLAAQHADGYWVGELEGDTILESEYILLLAWLGREHEPMAGKCARHILDQQLSGGGWAIYPGGPVDISASVKAYFGLKLTGHDAASEPIQRACAAILAHGGADAVNSFTRFYLALLGQIGYEQCPTVPPEFMLLPKWFPINLYAVSAWSRTIIVPLSIMSAHQPVRRIDSGRGIRELFIREPENWPPLRCPGLKGGTGILSWDRFFRTLDRGLKFLERTGRMPAREKAVRAAAKWMIDRFEGSDGLGAIFPPMVWSVIALKCLGYADDSPELQYCRERLDGLIIEEENTARLQPCKSPVWDTAISLRALSAAGLASDQESVEAAVDWLLDNEIRFKGDWTETVDCPPAGWCFEHANKFYPDLDDTAMVAMALHTQFDGANRESPLAPMADLELLGHDTCSDWDRAGAVGTNIENPFPYPLLATASRERTEGAETRRLHDSRIARLDRILSATARAEKWMLAMQNRDGGWGAFDRDNDREFLCHVPFADHNAMIDPSTPDLAARVLEALGHLGKRVGHPAVDRAVAYLRKTHEPDGSWFGRWGVNYIYGTWQVLVGLRAVGVPTSDAAVVAGANWIVAHQQVGGGWGESPDSYAEPHKRGQGNSTASQTAWALLGLMAAGYVEHSSVRRGIEYLIDCQRPDGGWDETEFTGTGFPRVFYLRYHMYPIYFPLLALAQYAKEMTNAESRMTNE
jgi:squalene-hopene/tetraprenyl-beta-curcumene cyclase